MSPQDQDFIDRVFSTGYSLISRGNQAVSDVASKVMDRVESASDEIGKQPLKIDHSARSNDGRLYKAFQWLYRGRRALCWGIGTTAVGVLLYWQFKHLVKIPARLPQSDCKCVLVLGDMRDPIVRSQVMDLYRRRFVVFVCTSSAKTRAYLENQEDDDFLRFIDPSSSSDLASFLDFISKNNEAQCRLASILFMPNLSYYPSGETSTAQLDSEIQTNVLQYYSTLVKLLPHLQTHVTQLILFNPSLSYNLSISHHQVEILISGLIQSIYQSLKGHKRLAVYMAHVGTLKLAAQPSNYKYLSLPGSNITTSMLQPIYDLIMTGQGGYFLRLGQWLRNFGSFSHILYCGKFSYLSTLPFASLLLWR